MLQTCGTVVLIQLLLSAVITSTRSQPTVTTRSGPIVGITQDYSGTAISAFLGIPYAQPPVGHLRFKRALPVEPWCLHSADKMPPACLQYSSRYFWWGDYEPAQSEDCLFLNIWVPPNTMCSDKKPVMFWIHGGGMYLGSNRHPVYDGRALAAEGDVIVVTINFRQGPLGFFAYQTDDAPGNAGFTDMVLALEWVNKNIEFFGGDKDNITPFGGSGGGQAVSLLCLSPEAKDKFTRVIIESCNAAMYLGDSNVLFQTASRNIAEAVGCNTLKDSPEEVMKCMRSKDALEILKASAAANPELQLWFPQYGDNVLPRNPREAIMAGEFQCGDMLVGDTADEGSIILPVFDPKMFGEFGYKKTTVDKSYAIGFLTKLLHSFPGQHAYIEHFKNSISTNNSDDLRHKLYDATGDYMISCPDVFIAEKGADNGNRVYFYVFGHRPSTSLYAPWTKAAHYEDVKFQFGMPLLHSQNYTCEEMSLSKQVIEVWSNFARNGVPRDGWPQYSRRNPKYFYMDTERFGEIGCGWSQENCDVLRPYFKS